MELTVQARRVMEALGDRFVSAGFPNPWLWPITVDELGGTLEELTRLGLLAQDPGAGSRCHVTDAGRTWIIDHRRLVVVFCPKCSTDEYVPKGQTQAHARCHVCGVGWTEDTTVEPFVPKY
jgi:hypothetical protein